MAEGFVIKYVLVLLLVFVTYLFLDYGVKVQTYYDKKLLYVLQYNINGSVGAVDYSNMGAYAGNRHQLDFDTFFVRHINHNSEFYEYYLGNSIYSDPDIFRFIQKNKHRVTVNILSSGTLTKIWLTTPIIDDDYDESDYIIY